MQIMFYPIVNLVKKIIVYCIYIYTTWKSPGIFQYVAPLENEHDSFREIHLSLVYI